MDLEEERPWSTSRIAWVSSNELLLRNYGERLTNQKSKTTEPVFLKTVCSLHNKAMRATPFFLVFNLELMRTTCYGSTFSFCFNLTFFFLSAFVLLDIFYSLYVVDGTTTSSLSPKTILYTILYNSMKNHVNLISLFFFSFSFLW